MINPKLLSVPVKNSPNFHARFYRNVNCKKLLTVKFMRHCYALTPLSSRVALIYQRENSNKTLVDDFNRQAMINHN